MEFVFKLRNTVGYEYTQTVNVRFSKMEDLVNRSIGTQTAWKSTKVLLQEFDDERSYKQMRYNEICHKFLIFFPKSKTSYGKFGWVRHWCG